MYASIRKDFIQFYGPVHSSFSSLMCMNPNLILKHNLKHIVNMQQSNSTSYFDIRKL